jgi:hypothetical protein
MLVLRELDIYDPGSPENSDVFVNLRIVSVKLRQAI